MTGFNNPYVLILLLLIPLGIIIYKKIISKKKKQAIKFSNVSYLKSALVNTKKNKRDKILFYLSLSIIGLMIIGFADPHIPLKQTKKGVNVVLVLDVSGSMQAEDYKPTRLEAAKNAAETLIKSLKKDDYVGIVTFSNGASAAAYLSPDKNRVINKLKAIRPANGQTAIGDGLAAGVDMASSIPNRKKVVVLLSDGVNNAGSISLQEAITYAKTNNIQVYTIGLGSEEPVILGRDFFGRAQYAELDEETLKIIAQQTNGKYFKSVNEKTLDEIYANISQDIKREKEDVSIKNYFFILAFILLLIEAYLRYGHKRVIA